MSWTNLRKPTQGEATKKALADAIIDNLAFLKTGLDGVGGDSVPNGGFENDVDEDNTPDAWTFTAYTGGTGSLSESIAIDDGLSFQGYRAFKIVHPGGSGNGGGYFEQSDFQVCSEFIGVRVNWLMQSSAAATHNKVEILWFDSTETAISSSTIYDNETTNPTAWSPREGYAWSPQYARFYKLRFYGGVNDNETAADIYFDGVKVEFPQFGLRRVVFSSAALDTTVASGTLTWTPPVDAYARVICIGAGGGGAGASSTNQYGGGGGAGGQAIHIALLDSSTPVTLVIGSPGDGKDNANGIAGGDTWFNWEAYGLGGAGGRYNSPYTGGAGGAASGNVASYTGGNGGGGGASTEQPIGGETTISGGAAPRIATSTTAMAGNDFGGGGAGAWYTSGAGGDGGKGAIIIEF